MRDEQLYRFREEGFEVSVPLRGKEGAGQFSPGTKAFDKLVSVPLRGKEGAGRESRIMPASKELQQFPSPCGVRRVRDPHSLE